MKRCCTLALMIGLVISSSIRAEAFQLPAPVIPNPVPIQSPPVPYPPREPSPAVVPGPVPLAAVNVICDIPVVPCPCPPIACPMPQTVRRVVPRTTYQTVTKTIMVPTTVMEPRQTQSVEYRDEVRERAVTVYEQVPETRAVTTQQTVLVPETRHRTETYTVQVPFERSIPESYTVDNIQTETRTGTRQITRCVASTEMRTVVTGGELVKRSVKSELGGVRVQTVLVGGCTKQEPVTVQRQQIVQQTYAYDVQVNRPETHTRLVQQTDYRTETRTRSAPETIQVPKVETRTHHVTEMRSVPRQKTETYTVQVPHVVIRQTQVCVTQMVAQQITERIPVTTYDVIEEPVSDCCAPFAR